MFPLTFIYLYNQKKITDKTKAIIVVSLYGLPCDMDPIMKIANDNNIPVILSLISIWYNNFYEAESEAIIPYSEYLKSFPSYLQQNINSTSSTFW